jgi:putative ABC transport system substrate-binding protein
MNHRRKLVIALGAGVLSAPLACFAQQQGKIWRIGVLSQRPVTLPNDYFAALPAGLKELGYVEGRNLAIVWRTADNDVTKFPALAAELGGLHLDAIVTGASSATAALLKAKVKSPIVMVNQTDPIAAGFIESLSRPGGNVTGITSINEELGPKQLELLLETIPKAAPIAVLCSVQSPSSGINFSAIESNARKIGVSVLRSDVRTATDISDVFALMKKNQIKAIIVMSDGLFNGNRKLIADLALKHHLPSISVIREFAEAGGLMSYGPSYADGFRRAAVYVDKIIKGAKPAVLPVERPTKFELVVNQRSAKALGIKIPNSILVQATKVIE